MELVLPGGPTRAALAALPLAAGNLAHAQDWPTKPIRLVVPFAPGGSSEIVARSVAAERSKQLGRLVFVENKPGGAGTIAMAEVARAAPRRAARVWRSDRPAAP